MSIPTLIVCCTLPLPPHLPIPPVISPISLLELPYPVCSINLVTAGTLAFPELPPPQLSLRTTFGATHKLPTTVCHSFSAVLPDRPYAHDFVLPSRSSLDRAFFTHSFFDTLLVRSPCTTLVFTRILDSKADRPSPSYHLALPGTTETSLLHRPARHHYRWHCLHRHKRCRRASRAWTWKIIHLTGVGNTQQR